MPEPIQSEGGLRTAAEREAVHQLADAFLSSPQPVAERLEHFTKYVRRQRITRLLALYEIFKKVLPVKGSVIECGVYQGFGLMSWVHFSAILEPVNLTRRIYGFDTFEGFPQMAPQDHSSRSSASKGTLSASSSQELGQLIALHDQNRYLGHIDKVHLIPGDATRTIPQFLEQNPHLVVSLLFLDFDLYEPTRAAIEGFYPRMPRGAIIAFDELDNPIWPGETQALVNTLGLGHLQLERLDFDPYIAYAAVQ